MKLAAYLKAEGLTQQEFANRVGISKRAVSMYAQGHRLPRPPILARIRKITNEQVTYDDFVSDETETVSGEPTAC